MKKALVLGMILLALGTFAYADGGATVGMDFGRTQITVASGASGTGASTNVMQGWGPGLAGFPSGERIDFQFAWSNQYTGINSTFYVGNDYYSANGHPAIDVVNLYGTLKLLPDMFTMYVGDFEGDGWDHFRLDSNHPIHDVNNNNVGRFVGWGAIFDVMPKDTGFEVAAFMKIVGPSAGYTITLQQSFSQYALAASYTVPNLVKVSVGTNAFGYYNPVATASALGSIPAERNIFASVQLLMIPNLTLWDEGYIAGFDVTSPPVANTYTIWSNEIAAQYVMGQLTVVLAVFVGGNSWGGSPDYPNYGASATYHDYRLLNGNKDFISYFVDPEIYYNLGVASVGLYASVGGSNLDSGTFAQPYSGIMYYVEPYVKLNNFGLRVSFGYSGNTASNSISTWEVPIIIDWGF